jgi:hypothetical protein
MQYRILLGAVVALSATTPSSADGEPTWLMPHAISNIAWCRGCAYCNHAEFDRRRAGVANAACNIEYCISCSCPILPILPFAVTSAFTGINLLICQFQLGKFPSPITLLPTCQRQLGKFPSPVTRYLAGRSRRQSRGPRSRGRPRQLGKFPSSITRYRPAADLREATGEIPSWHPIPYPLRSRCNWGNSPVPLPVTVREGSRAKLLAVIRICRFSTPARVEIALAQGCREQRGYPG